jgi:hypothetical protein
MYEQPERLRWLHARVFQVVLAAFVLVLVVTLVLSVMASDGLTLGPTCATLGLTAMLIGSLVDRHRITGRW